MSKGMVCRPGSPLVKFEIEKYSDGTKDENMPCVVWVDARKPLRPAPGGIGCGCDGPFYPVRRFPEGMGATDNAGHTPSVCLCMGRFIE